MCSGFVCAAENELIFTSDRIAVAYLLLGILQNLSKKLYKTECTIQMEQIFEGSVQRFRYLFKIDEGEKPQPEIIPRSVSANPQDLQMTKYCIYFAKLFVFKFFIRIALRFVKCFPGILS